ncbi:arachidonate 5-lipoxygenase-activating protein isoform X5 [Denticeps clupeoides]|uniref:arachidonate 5-lipoxygenase-activating protein isoform X5 n=1 Tax=Denticeps clupeoides TaxID=299321 RepID=UPI0010A2AA2E|nr:arachidonate 5-lipoxygenase-activating protein isoform X5 [Denticeps clupeoides]
MLQSTGVRHPPTILTKNEYRDHGEHLSSGVGHSLKCHAEWRNCMDLYPTFLAIMWCAGICLSQAAAAFAGLMYLFSRQKYFVGYMGQTSQSTLGYLFGKRVLSFLFLMCLVGIGNFLLVKYWSNDYKEYIQTITNAASTLLLIP